MILQQVVMQNFGIYGGEATFDLRPIPHGNFHRPVVLVEMIVCLHFDFAQVHDKNQSLFVEQLIVGVNGKGFRIL